MNEVRRDAASLNLTYFAYTGVLLMLVVLLTTANRIRLGVYGWMFTWQLAAIGLATLAFTVAALVRRVPDASRRARVLGWTATAGYVVTALALAVFDHRRFIIAIAFLETAVLCALPFVRTYLKPLHVGLLAFLTWSMASGMTYTRLADWLLNGAPSSALAIGAFVFAFALVTVELASDGDERRASGLSRVILAIGFVLFVLYALRTDNMLVNWVPLHRSYFADTSQFVRDGHWLLYDVPSLYGFLSMLALAIVPASNGWQALFELTAVILVLQACVTTVILRWGRSGYVNAAFAVLFPLATLFGESIARYAWGDRLYPQGGMRFIWIVALIFVAFLMYVYRSDEGRVRVLRWIGHAVWLIALLWSIENALWASVVWLPYVVLDALTYPSRETSLRRAATRLFRRGWPLVVLPALAIVTIDTIYRVALGVNPDWLSYVEFTGPFAHGTIRAIFHVQDFGAGWILLLVLGATGAIGIVAARERSWDLLRLLAAAWLAVWGTASYFALEPLDMYVSLLMGVLAPAIAVTIFASREALGDRSTQLLARLSFAPMAAIVIALALGEPSRLAAMRTPLAPGWSADVTQLFPPIHGELAELTATAGIAAGDPVLVPNGPFWTELTQGIVLPFARGGDGKIAEYRSWLPLSPVGPEELIEGLPKARQQVYVERFLDRSRRGGWYIAYRQDADCRELSPQLATVRTYRSTNFSVSFCRYAGKTPRLSANVEERP